MVVFVAAFMPLLRRQDEAARGAMLHDFGVHFRTVSWACFARPPSVRLRAESATADPPKLESRPQSEGGPSAGCRLPVPVAGMPDPGCRSI